ncbi:hypothetical protein CVT26_004141, partial [Gymnopilus dilepis]
MDATARKRTSIGRLTVCVCVFVRPTSLSLTLSPLSLSLSSNAQSTIQVRSRQMSMPSQVVYNDAATMTESTTPLINAGRSERERVYRDACINTDLVGANGESDMPD